MAGKDRLGKLKRANSRLKDAEKWVAAFTTMASADFRMILKMLDTGAYIIKDSIGEVRVYSADGEHSTYVTSTIFKALKSTGLIKWKPTQLRFNKESKYLINRVEEFDLIMELLDRYAEQRDEDVQVFVAECQKSLSEYRRRRGYEKSILTRSRKNPNKIHYRKPR